MHEWVVFMRNKLRSSCAINMYCCRTCFLHFFCTVHGDRHKLCRMSNRVNIFLKLFCIFNSVYGERGHEFGAVQSVFSVRVNRDQLPELKWSDYPKHGDPNSTAP